MVLELYKVYIYIHTHNHSSPNGDLSDAHTRGLRAFYSFIGFKQVNPGRDCKRFLLVEINLRQNGGAPGSGGISV